MAYKNQLQFEYKDCTVDVYRVEESNLFSVELFPLEQSTESLESAEFSGIFNVESLLNHKYSGYEFYGILEHYPEGITSTDYDAIFDIIRKDIQE